MKRGWKHEKKLGRPYFAKLGLACGPSKCLNLVQKSLTNNGQVEINN